MAHECIRIHRSVFPAQIEARPFEATRCHVSVTYVRDAVLLTGDLFWFPLSVALPEQANRAVVT